MTVTRYLSILCEIIDLNSVITIVCVVDSLKVVNMFLFTQSSYDEKGNIKQTT